MYWHCLNVLSLSPLRTQPPSTTPDQTGTTTSQGAPGDSPVHFPGPPGMMSPDMTQGPPPNMPLGGPPMMGPFGPDGGMMPLGPPPNFFENFFNQQQGMQMEGVVEEGEQRSLNPWRGEPSLGVRRPVTGLIVLWSPYSLKLNSPGVSP